MKARQKKKKRLPPSKAGPENQKPSVQERLQVFTHSRWGYWGIPLALFVGALLLGGGAFDEKLSLSGDNTEFITLARSLAQSQGLSYINTPNPQPATKYPFGFPLMLAPLAWLFPEEWVPMKWLVMVLFALAMPIIYWLVDV